MVIFKNESKPCILSNREIAKTFQFLAKIMDFHGESAFKTKAYTNAYLNIRKLPNDLDTMSLAEIATLPGIGKAISEKIIELCEKGSLEILENYKSNTPGGIQNLLTMKGLGAKKLRLIHDNLGITTPGELLYACRENRLLSLKGFGQKSQDSLIPQLEYFIESQGRYHYATLDRLVQAIVDILWDKYPNEGHAITGAMRRKCIIIDEVEILTSASADEVINHLLLEMDQVEQNETGVSLMGCPLHIIETDAENYCTELFYSTGPSDYVADFDELIAAESEEAIYEASNRAYIVPEVRDNLEIIRQNIEIGDGDLIQHEDLKGVLHNHSTWSDGVNSIREMAQACIDRGYQYLLMTDHSQTAFYANGLDTDRVLAQMEEIDQLNEEFQDFRIYKGIESDILSNGALDYEDDILALFDVIVASVHSNLKMDVDKATRRLLTAIENPYTHILGHPTGRLLLSREAYPLHWDQILDACKANDVVIELNANPHRLDIDWSHIQGALDRGIQIAINPDAHSTAGIDHMRYGVFAARKGGLTTDMCLNALDATGFNKWVKTLKY